MPFKIRKAGSSPQKAKPETKPDRDWEKQHADILDSKDSNPLSDEAWARIDAAHQRRRTAKPD